MMLTVYSRLWKDWYNGICHRAGWTIINGIVIKLYLGLQKSVDRIVYKILLM